MAARATPTLPATEASQLRRGQFVSLQLHRSGLDAGVNRRPALRIALGLAQDFASERRDVALAAEQIADEIEERIAFGPIEVGVRNFSCFGAQMEQERGDRIRVSCGVRAYGRVAQSGGLRK